MLLHLISDVENARICEMCEKENEIPRKNCQDNRDILKESSENDLLYYPVLTESEPSEILQNMEESMDSEAILMERFDKELTN